MKIGWQSSCLIDTGLKGVSDYARLLGEPEEYSGKEGNAPVKPDLLTSGHIKSEDLLRQEMCVAGRWMYERAFIVAAEGNLSVRLGNGRILTTPTCLNKGMLAPADLVVTNSEGGQISGTRKASSELAMHLLFYRMRPDVNAICHAHPPTATGFAVAGRGLDRALLPEVIVGLGQVPLVQYATPGTPDLSAVIEPFAPHYDALLLANHGAVTCGPDLLTAFFRMETIEHSAKITLAAESAGEPMLLSSREVARLMAARERYSVLSPPGGGGGLPVTSDSCEVAEEYVTLTRGELDVRIEEAVRKDRARG
jgi:L-fuculose-phosphate aldolase